ncbi:MAG: hypothetical protein ACD_78C00289G0001 [uncultured bacterium (gcode 4)]|uniref:Type IV pilus biogenesis protein PilN n=1 Tax=uncultured bacterium (gcode 4) TaxID=1234023 RepID=K1YBN8_9BACT|nr:MAG: hypothetical protein ACD_78C00289G0001 [uncultured bacterium (gcode 4)]MDP2104019.1 hypothetical protein [Candidatus Gracilibacteria bacterium]
MKTLDVRVGKEDTEALEIKASGSTFLITSGIILAVVLALSTFLFLENNNLTRSIETSKSESERYDESIAKLKSDKKIIAAELVKTNQVDILKKIRAGEVQKYISELITLSRKYKINLSGFSYSNGKISTAATAIAETTRANDDAVKKISALVRDYRTGSGLIFSLSPVTSVSGYEQKRLFGIDFTVNTDNLK